MIATPGAAPVRVGRYLLCDVIGGGGMAKVHLGRAFGAAGFSRMVAIKRLHAARARDPRFSTMLVDEARLVSRIRHPNVVPTLDVVAADGELILVMEYVPGLSLAQLIALAKLRGETVPRSIAVRLLLDVLAGLGAAHSASSERGRALGIVHRDVSPQNVIAGTDGIARVVDFGIAKAEGKLSITREGEIKGKLAYMAPEQLRGEEVDPRADLYSAAVVLWELVTGRRLFEPEGDLATSIAKVLASEVPAASTLVAVSPALDALLVRALAAQRGGRYESAAAMAEALEAASEVAQPKEVAAFVAQVGGAALEQREELIAHVEQLSVSYEGTGNDEAPPEAPPETAPTEVMAAQTARLPNATLPLALPGTQPLAVPVPVALPVHVAVPVPTARVLTLPLAPVAPPLPAPEASRPPSRTRLAALVIGVAAVGGLVLLVGVGPRACTRRNASSDGEATPTSIAAPSAATEEGVRRKHERHGRRPRGAPQPP